MYKEQRQFGDSFLEEIKLAICPKIKITIAGFDDDCKKATDLIVETKDGIKRIAVRTRRYGMLRYSDEFTIRAYARSKKTEIDKIMEGFCDYAFFSFENENGKLGIWRLYDLNVFRQYFKELKNPNKIDNHDGTTGFYAFKFKDLPKNFVVKSCLEDRMVVGTFDFETDESFIERIEKELEVLCWHTICY
jgi:predicted HTH transcriptional regulator